LRLSDRLIENGLVTRDMIERALRSKAESGGSLALNLVLHGAVDEELLAHFYAQHFGFERVNAHDVRNIRPEIFHLIPTEIIYDNGVIPLRRETDSSLAVGVIDPSEPERLEEAEFFASLKLKPMVMRVTEMAEAFERMTGQSWKVPFDELERTQRMHSTGGGEAEAIVELIDAMIEVEPIIERRIGELDMSQSLAEQVDAFVEPSTRLPRTKPLGQHRGAQPHAPDHGVTTPMAVIEEASETPSVVVSTAAFMPSARGHDLASASHDEENDEPVIRAYVGREDFSPPRGTTSVDDLPYVAEQETGDRGEDATMEMARISMEAIEEGIARYAERGTFGGEPPDSDDDASAFDGATTRFLFDRAAAMEDRSNEDRVVHDEVDAAFAAARSTTRLPYSGDGPSTNGEATSRDTGELANLSMQSRAQAVSRTLRLSAVIGTHDATILGGEGPEAAIEGYRERSNTTNEHTIRDSTPRPSVAIARTTHRTTPTHGNEVVRAARERRLTPSVTSGPWVVPTVDSTFVDGAEGRFDAPGGISSAMGPAAGTTRAAFRCALKCVESAVHRDAIAAELVDALGLVYPTALMLTVRAPQMVVWRATVRRGPTFLASQVFDINDGSVWHRVVGENVAFRGALCEHDPLRVLLGRELGRDTMLIPVVMNRRAVAVIALDAGYEGELAPAAGQIDPMLRAVESALRRVILQRKRSLQPVEGP